MRILEDRHPGESWWLWKLGNWTTAPIEWVRSVAFSVGSKVAGEWRLRPMLYRSAWTANGLDALFYNAVLFVRVVWPVGIFVQIRWSGRTDRRAYVQFGAGWKLNGRFGLIARIPRSDAHATTGQWSGVAGENVSTPGWEWGPK